MERAARREQVLACARSIFSRKGYHATTVADIIEEAGVARGTFYLYFKSKRSVFDELLDEFQRKILAQIRRIDTGEGAPPPVAQLLDEVERIISVLFESHELTRILLHEAVGLDADFDRKLESFYRQLAQVTEASLGLGQQMGLVRQCDVRVAALCVLGSVKEVVGHYLVAPDRLPERSAVAREILQVMLAGVFVPSVTSGLARTG